MRPPDFFGDRRNARLQDLAIQTGATTRTRALHSKPPSWTKYARSVVITQDSTTIVDAAGDRAQISERITQIRQEIEQTDSDWDRRSCRSAWPSWPAGSQ